MCHSQYTTHTFKHFTSALISSCTKGLHVTTAEEMTKKINENSFLKTLYLILDLFNDAVSIAMV
jgi:hypothetical protein